MTTTAFEKLVVLKKKKLKNLIKAKILNYNNRDEKNTKLRFQQQKINFKATFPEI